MKSIMIPDNRTGEQIELSYDPGTGSYLVNGKAAQRQQPLEDEQGEYVFTAPELAPGKLFHFSADALEVLRGT